MGNRQLCAAPVEDVQVRIIVGVGVRLGCDQLLEVLHQVLSASLLGVDSNDVGPRQVAMCSMQEAMHEGTPVEMCNSYGLPP